MFTFCGLTNLCLVIFFSNKVFNLYRLANKMPHIFTSFNLLLYWSIGINHCKFKICYAAF